VNLFSQLPLLDSLIPPLSKEKLWVIMSTGFTGGFPSFHPIDNAKKLKGTQGTDSARDNHPVVSSFLNPSAET